MSAMISSEVQRTLVKSPPELWAELSDPFALARHLGALGEIRITRTEPERTVEWEAENVTGSVSIQPSGWGTKVTLKVSREIADPAPPPDATEAERAIDIEHGGETEPHRARAPEPDCDAALEPEPDSNAAGEPDSGAMLGTDADAIPEPNFATTYESDSDATSRPSFGAMPEPRRGFFARLFRRRSTTPPPARDEPARPDAFAAVSQALAPATFAATDAFAAPQATQPTPAPPAPVPDAMQPEALASGPEPSVEAPPAPSTEAAPAPQAEALQDHEEQAAQREDISAELMAAEEVAAEEVTAVLTAVLDRLGAAHHRPFSRA